MREQNTNRRPKLQRGKEKGLSPAGKIFNLRQDPPRVDSLASFLDLNPNPAMGMKFDGSIQYLNPAAKRLFLADQDMEPQPGWLKAAPCFSEFGKVVKVEKYSELLKKWYSISVYGSGKGGCLAVFEDITERKRIEEERERLLQSLQDALAKMKRLHGILPICCSCKKIRDDKGDWNHIELYIQEHSEAAFTHGFCPECLKELYGFSLEEEESLHKPQARANCNSCNI